MREIIEFCVEADMLTLASISKVIRKTTGPLLLCGAQLYTTITTLAQATEERPASKSFFLGTEEYPLAPRYALVVGVPKLKESSGFTSLKNPANDAIEISQALRSVGFNVIALNEQFSPEELTRQNIKKAVYDLAKTLKLTGGVGLIYFAGHGLEKDGRAYVVPYDAYVQYERDLDEELIPRTMFYDAFKFAGNQLNLLIIDACRDDPWTRELERFGESGSHKVVYKDEERRPRPLIQAFSTTGSAKASDGEKKNSPYAIGFKESLKAFDLSITEFFDSVARSIRTQAEGNTSLDDSEIAKPGGYNFIFSPSIDSFNLEQQIFEKLKKTRNRGLYEDLISRYAGGYFYKAAVQWKESVPFQAIVPGPPTQIVELRTTANLQDAPNVNSEVLDTRTRGELLPVVGKQQIVGGVAWSPVYIAQESKFAYIRADAVRVLSKKPDSAAYEMTFLDNSASGMEALSPNSKARVKSAFEGGKQALITRVDVVGFRSKGESEKDTDLHELLTRQGEVLYALEDAGYDASKAVVYRDTTDDKKKIGTVSLIINGITDVKQAKPVYSGARDSGHGANFSTPYKLCSDPLPEGAEIMRHDFSLQGDRTCGRWATCKVVVNEKARVCYEFALQGHSEFPENSVNGGIRQSWGVLAITYRAPK